MRPPYLGASCQLAAFTKATATVLPEYAATRSQRMGETTVNKA
jgi:hypothetical protein